MTGVVVNLHREEGQIEGRVTVACVIEGVVRQLQAILAAADYDRAIEAHREQKGVMFRADIARAGRGFRASNVREFRVVE